MRTEKLVQHSFAPGWPDHFGTLPLERWGGKANTTNLRIALRFLSISDAYLRTIEPSVAIALVSLLIWNSRLQVAKCPRSRPKRSSATAIIPTAGITYVFRRQTTPSTTVAFYAGF